MKLLLSKLCNFEISNIILRILNFLKNNFEILNYNIFWSDVWDYYLRLSEKKFNLELKNYYKLIIIEFHF